MVSVKRKKSPGCWKCFPRGHRWSGGMRWGGRRRREAGWLIERVNSEVTRCVSQVKLIFEVILLLVQRDRLPSVRWHLHRKGWWPEKPQDSPNSALLIHLSTYFAFSPPFPPSPRRLTPLPHPTPQHVGRLMLCAQCSAGMSIKAVAGGTISAALHLLRPGL